MKQIRQFYKWLNILSIDVATGAVVSALFFSRILHLQLRSVGLICLGITVWMIYTADHLLDAWTLKARASTERHKFHQRNFKILVILLLLASCADLTLIFFIKVQVFRWGIGLAVCVLLYFVVQTKLKSLKEVVGAILYSAGVLLPSLSVTEYPLAPFVVLLIAQFVMTALINLILFSWFDRQRDLQDSRSSLITIFGNAAGKVLLGFLFLAQVLVSIYLILNSNYFAEVIVFMMMNLVLLVIFLANNYFSMHDRYRYAGDAIFFFPLVYLIAG